MQKPYLISLASYTIGVDRYLASLDYLGDSVELIYVDFEPRVPTHDYFEDLHDFRLYDPKKSYPGHHNRWKHIPDDLDQDRWWIFTDTQDVIFQRPIPDLDQFGADVLVQAEGMTHAENQVWRECIEGRWPEQANLLPLPVYNCGCWAARGHLMHGYKSYIAGYDAAMWDQIPFNQWLIGKNFKDCPELSAALYLSFYSGRLSRLDGTYFWTGTGLVPSIVHGNGSSKEIL
jgi:hypothetical protein